ncbi:MAG: glycosyltransferase family 4 protein [Phycisphaeraceae bacterium]|nr:glycosyltransferase family 4 protein [Phycisphaerae bacterium]MBX3392341.1 glycosyltransferase family 4 protein [Phycisphaeraceae bacterium]
MNSTLADALVLTLPAAMTLRQWVRAGVLAREWPLYERLGADYGRILLVTYGNAEDLAFAAAWPESSECPSGRPPTIICNQTGADPDVYASRLPEIVSGTIDDCSSAVIKTCQMQGGEIAARIAERLRGTGRRTGLIGRGGYLWSRFVSKERGPDSSEAARAAACEELLCRSSDVVIGTTPRMIDDLAWRYAISPDRLHLVPNFVGVESEPTPSSDRETDRILYAGPLVRRKRVDVLIEAAASIRAEGRPGVVLEVIGEGPEEASLRSLARELQAPVDFRSSATRGEILDRMSRCSIYAQASELEGHPTTVLEAMATGAAVVVADSPGLAEVVQIGATGLRVPCDAEGFSHAIGQLLGDDDWRDALGFAASRFARETCSLERVVPLERRAHESSLRAA